MGPLLQPASDTVPPRWPRRMSSEAPIMLARAFMLLKPHPALPPSLGAGILPRRSPPRVPYPRGTFFSVIRMFRAFPCFTAFWIASCAMRYKWLATVWSRTASGLREVANTPHRKGALDAGHQFLQGGHQAPRHHLYRAKASRQVVGLLNRFIELALNRSRLARIHRGLSRQFALQQADLVLRRGQQLAYGHHASPGPCAAAPVPPRSECLAPAAGAP